MDSCPRFCEDVNLAPYTSARIGGPADFLLEVRSSEELAQRAQELWTMEMPFRILGGGSNVLISDRGIRGVILLNHAREVTFMDTPSGPRVMAESGASLGSVSRRSVERCYSHWRGPVGGTKL